MKSKTHAATIGPLSLGVRVGRIRERGSRSMFGGIAPGIRAIAKLFVQCKWEYP